MSQRKEGENELITVLRSSTGLKLFRKNLFERSVDGGVSVNL